MPTLRGWDVRELSKARGELVTVSGTKPNGDLPVVAGFPTHVRAEVAPLFLELILRLQKLRRDRGLSALTSGGGYAFRPVRGNEKAYAKSKNPALLSNHSLGLAVDLCVATNPMGRPLRTDWPRPEVDRIARECGLTFGAEWSRPDPMHFEFIGTPAEARAHVERLKNQGDDLTPEQDAMLRAVYIQLLGPDPAHPGWPQLGGKTLVDALASVKVDTGDTVIQLGGPSWKGWPQLGGLSLVDAVASLKQKIGA